MADSRYVDFVSDDHFLECVGLVCDSYPDLDHRGSRSLWRNGIDPFKMVFDIMNCKIDLERWDANELVRQNDKTVNNRIGDFHQKLLGGVDGWTDLGTGDRTKLDLKRDDDAIFLELKNRFNTVNADSLSAIRGKLEANLERFPDSVSYWAFIVEKGGTSGESDWKYKGRKDPRIRKVWGSRVYSLVTGSDDSLERVWIALPDAINEIRSADHPLADTEKLRSRLNAAFNSRA